MLEKSLSCSRKKHSSEIIQFVVSSKLTAINWLARIEIKKIQMIDKFEIFICNQEEAYFTGILYNKEKQAKKLDNLVKGVVVMTKGRIGLTISNGEHLWLVFLCKSADTTELRFFYFRICFSFCKNKKIITNN